MKKISNVVAVLGLALAVSCVSPSDPQSTTPATNSALASPAKVIQNLTLGTVDLPASLQRSSTSGARGLETVAIGDLPAVKGGLYFTMVDNLTGVNMIDSMLTMLKTSPVVTGNTVALNGVTETGTVTLLWRLSGQTVTVELPESGKVKTALSSDAKFLEIWWKLSYPDLAEVNQVDNKDDLQKVLNDTTKRVAVNLYFKVATDGSVEVWAQADSFALKEHTTYNPSTKALMNAQTAMGRPFVQSVTPLANGDLQFWSTDGSQVVAGQANGTLGAMVMASTDGTNSWKGAEFYGADASLLVQYQGLSASGLDFSTGITHYPVRALTLAPDAVLAMDPSSHIGTLTQGATVTPVVSSEFQTWNPTSQTPESVWAPVVDTVPAPATFATDLTALQASLTVLWATASKATADDALADFEASWAVIKAGFAQ